jgi:hypothetical protein
MSLALSHYDSSFVTAPRLRCKCAGNLRRAQLDTETGRPRLFRML